MTCSNSIRFARNYEFSALRAIETAADRVFTGALVGPLPPAADTETYLAASFVLVAGEPVLGFARVNEVDGNAHLEQVAVLPNHHHSGIGGRLLEAVAATARERGYRTVTLITFANIEWNGPFYLKRGFAPLLKLGPGLTALRVREKRIGLDDLGTRIVLARKLL